MSSFLQYGNVYPEVQNTITSRAGNNLLVSQLKPWIRVSSSYNNGLVIASNLQSDTFEARYGEPVTLSAGFVHDSGRVGNNFAGDSVWPRATSFNRQHRPSPVIEAISIKNGTEGLSRKLNFTIKAFTLPQLDMITAYFLEPRFWCLAEWGWNTQLAYNQMAKVQNTSVNSATCDIISYINLGVLKDKRKNSQGNYDAFLGVITGGSVDYGEDETYLVNVEVMTQGEIPAYLQQHKGTPLKIDFDKETGKVKDGQRNKSSELFDPETEIQDAESANEFGKALFMYMYNDLPLCKRTQRLMKYVDDPIWTSEYNYINMNQTAREKMSSELKDETVKITNREYNGSNDQIVDTKIPDGQPLIGKERFIRMELAWEILNTTDLILAPQQIQCGDSKKSLDSQISIENTIVRAHKHMFSVNKDTLYVPNAKAPDFGLYDVLMNTNESSESFIRFEDGQLATKNLEPNGLPEANKFPQPIECKVSGIKVFDDSVFEINQDAYEWGYLKDLYINFDFFVSCMSKNGYVIKDVAIDILNGLSSGVNLFWDFQIVEAGSTSTKNGNSGDSCLIVVDKNFSGKPPGTYNSTLSLQSIGTKSPFLDFKMKMEVIGAIANQVMAQTNQATSPEMSSYAVEDKVEAFRGLFATQPDRVGLLLNTIHKESLEYAREEAEQQQQQQEAVETDVLLTQYKAYMEYLQKVSAGTAVYDPILYTPIENLAWALLFNDKVEESVNLGIENKKAYVISATTETTNYITEGESTTETKKRKTNYDIFMQNAGVYPLINNPNINFRDLDINTNLDTLVIDDRTIVCGVWQDTQLLRQIYEYDLRGGGIIDYKIGASKNPGYLPIEVTFTIHGVSGIKVGDMLHFKDLPAIYRSKLFSVFDVEHTLNDDMWQTTVVSKLRPIDYNPNK